jgi:regulator of replication initiation timing
MTFNRARFDELISKLQRSPMSADELKELGTLQSQLSKLNEGREALIKDVQKSIDDNKILVLELFGTARKLGKLLTEQGVKPESLFPTAKAATDEDGQATPATLNAVERPSNKNEELIKSKGHGKPFIYKRGRVFEDAKGEPTTDLKKVYAGALSKFFTTHKTAAAIKEAATEAGKTYFATPEGKKELDKLVELAQLA